MRIVIFNWRGPTSAKSGGAERVTDVLASGLAARGHAVVWYTSRAGAEAEREDRNGYTILRAGSELTCRFHAAAWLWRNRAGFDVVVDEVNTLPFFSPLVRRGRVVLWIHQLAKEVWTAEAPPVIGAVGFAAEPSMLAIYRNVPAVTGAQSSVESLRTIGLRGEISVIEYPLPRPEASPSLPRMHNIGYLGRVTPSKRIDHIIRALAITRRIIPDVRLTIVGAGDASEVSRLQKVIADEDAIDAVEFRGRVSMNERDVLLRSFDVLCLASLREGWGLVVSEAARFGVPSVVYPVAGLVDSVQDGRTGIVVPAERPASLAQGLVRVLSDRALRDRLGREAMRFLEPYTEERFVDRFERVLAERAATARSSV